MGTILGALFILAAAATGVIVGTRSTVIDGRRIAERLEETAGPRGYSVECDREIRLGADGAAFACTYSGLDGSHRVELRMSRDGMIRTARPEPGL